MKTQMKHTSGPWRIGDAGTAIFGPKQEDGSLATTIATNIHRRDNANLISTAPEMFIVLEKLRDEIISHGANGDMENLSLIDVVIRKAKGEQ